MTTAKRDYELWIAMGLCAVLMSVVGLGNTTVSAEDGDAASPSAATGTLTGKIDSPWIRRSPAIVYLADVPGEVTPPKEHAKLDQQQMKFIPHVLPIVKGTTVDFPNNDSVQHNVFSPSRSAKSFNVGVYPPGAEKSVTFDKVGVAPLLCVLHSEMSGFVVVLPNRYFSTTAQDGTFTIKDVPPGTYTLAFWNEHLEPKSVKVPIKAGKTTRVTFSDLKQTRQYGVELLADK